MNRREAELFPQEFARFAESIGRLVNDPNFDTIPREVRIKFRNRWMKKIVPNQATAQAWVKFFQRKFNLPPYDFSWVEIIVRTDLRKEN